MKTNKFRAEVRRRMELAERIETQVRNEELAAAAAAEHQRRMDHEHICLLGEIRPGENYTTAAEALIVALRFAKAYGLDTPVTVNETTLLDLERRVFYEAQRTKLARLVYLDGTLSELETTVDDEGTFDEVWSALPDANLPITQDQLDAAEAEISKGKNVDA